MYDKFINIIKQTINKHVPMKIASQQQQNLLERPWITWLLIVSTKVSINQNQKMYKTHFLSEGENLFSLYKTYANELNRIKYFAKKNFSKMFHKHKSNPQKTWQFIKSLLPNVDESSPSINKI